MAMKIEDETEAFKRKMKGRQSALFSNRNAMIWTLAMILGIGMILIGYIDWLADYDIISTNSPYQVIDPATGEITIYDPLLGKVKIPTEGGFLPAGIGISIHEWIILGIITMLGIPSILIYQVEGKRLGAIDENMPYLLREIADSQRIGMTLPRAIAEASKRNYGPLSGELKKLAAKISWGIPFRDAMRTFRDALDTPMSRQATMLILEAERSGGELEKIFDSAQHYVQELLDVKKTRESSIKPYIYIIMVSYIIFIVVIFTLFTTFFAPFGVQEIQVQGGETIVAVPLEAFKVAFLYLLMVQAFFSGLTAGKMGMGKIKLGLFYSTIWMALGLLVYKFLIIPAVEAIEADALP